MTMEQLFEDWLNSLGEPLRSQLISKSISIRTHRSITPVDTLFSVWVSDTNGERCVCSASVPYVTALSAPSSENIYANTVASLLRMASSILQGFTPRTCETYASGSIRCSHPIVLMSDQEFTD